MSSEKYISSSEEEINTSGNEENYFGRLVIVLSSPEHSPDSENHGGENISTYINEEDQAKAGPSTFICDVCYKEFDDKYLQEQHKSDHTSEKSFPNRVSGNSDSKTKVFKQSKLSAAAKKRYQCDQCPKTFADKTYLVRHKTIHTGKEPFQCEKCHKKFTTKHVFLTHLRIHTGEKPHECEMCHKKFTHRSNLATHLRNRTCQKLHNCEKCGSSFPNRSSFKKHN